MKLSTFGMRTKMIKYMLRHVEEYELVKSKHHKKYRFAREFFKAKNICYQNFYKFYNRYTRSGRDASALLPLRRGPNSKYLDLPTIDINDIESRVLSYRKKGYNRYIISSALNKEGAAEAGPCSASTVYRIFTKFGVSRLGIINKVNKVKIVRDKAGSLLHIDCHFLSKGLVKDHPLKRYYVLGVIDDYSRIAWAEIISNVRAVDATFAMMDALLILNQEYGITADEVMTDNGSEFCAGKTTMDRHPFERLLSHFGLKHIRTKPYRPQTNGKIERFWRSFEEEVIEGAEFDTLDDLKEAVLGYNFFFNANRPHQGIGGKTPLEMLTDQQKEEAINV